MNGIVAIGFALLSAMFPSPFPPDAQVVLERVIPDRHLRATVTFLGNAKQIIEANDVRLSIFLATLKKERDKNIGPYFQDNTATEIEVWLFQEKYDDLSWPIQKFKEIIPFVTINTRTFIEPTDYYKTVESALKSNDAPDIVLIRNGWLSKLKDNLAPAPKDLFTPHECYDFFYKFACDAFVNGNNIYGAPLLVKPLVMILNTELLNDDRITLNNRPDKLWFGFAENGKKFIQYGSAQKFFTYISPSSDNPSITMLFSALILQAESVGADVQTATKDILELMRTINEFANQKSSIRLTRDPIYHFVKGEVAVIFGTQDTYVSILNQLIQNTEVGINRNDIAIAQVPQVDPKNQVTAAEAWSLAVPKNSNRVNQAWSVAAYLVEESSATAFAQRTGKVPARKFILLDDPFADAAKSAEDFPNGSGEFAFESFIRENLSAYFLKRQTTEEVQQAIMNFLTPDDSEKAAKATP